MNPTETREIMEDIGAIHERGCTILLIEHDMGLVEGLADRVIAIDHGTKAKDNQLQSLTIQSIVGFDRLVDGIKHDELPIDQHSAVIAIFFDRLHGMRHDD